MTNKIEKYKYIMSIIIPIYNGENYIDDSVNSILKQTLGFKKNIEIILIDDGSTDNSGKKCQNYVKKYPNNIIYIKQENKGVSAARNQGIAITKGKYTMFLDVDDKLEKNTLKKVYEFFLKHENEIDVVACRQKYFEAACGYTSLDYKFIKGTKIVDIYKYPSYIQASVTSSVFLSKAIKNRLFDTRLKYGEDSKFLNEVILEKEKYGILREAIHLYRKRKDESSVTQVKVKPLTRYLGNLELYYEYFYDLSEKKYGKILPYIQYLIMNAIKYRVIEELPNIFTKEEKERYISGIINIIKKTDDDIILDLKKCAFNTKLYLLKLKYDNKIKITYKNGNIYIDKKDISKSQKLNNLYIEDIKIEKETCIIKGYVTANLYQKNINLKIKTNQKTNNITLDKEIITKSFIQENIMKEITFQTKIKLNKDLTKCSFYVDETPVSIIPTKNVNKLKDQLILINNKIITKKQNTLTIKTKKILRIIKIKLQNIKNK